MTASLPAVAPDATVELNDDEMIKYVQGKRKQIVDHLFAKEVPSDSETLNVALRALEGAASTAIANKRVRTDQEGNEQTRKARDQFFHLIEHLGGRNPYESKDGNERDLPEVPAVLLDGVKEAPGELTQGVESDNFDDFAKRHDLL